jgi:hypothetical protein
LYFNLFLTGPFENTTLPSGYIFLFPLLVFITLELLLSKGWIFPRKNQTAPPKEYYGLYLPVLIFAVIYGFIDVMILLWNSEKAWSAQIFFVYALFFAIYAVLKARPILSLLATGSLALAVFFSLNYFKTDHILTLMLLLAAVYYLAGLGMTFNQRTRSWSDIFIWSGLGLGSLAAIFAPFNQDPITILGVTVIAVSFAVEAWRKREVWLGVPACLVFYLAYLTALMQLDINQPQYYSIGAAVLGIVMHNLFLRSRNPYAALISGIFTILILLSTTFLQMSLSEQLRFFLLLFIEGLLLMGYGLLMRSRSFFFIPIVYLVLATIVVVLTVLSGVPTALVIGCTGLLLLGVGILALLMHERLLKATERVGDLFRVW